MKHRVMLTIDDDALIVEGLIPVEQFLYIGEMAKSLGFDTVYGGFASAMEANFVFSNEAGAERLTERLNRDNPHTDPLRRWLAGPDTGTSSLTIVRAICGRHLVPAGHRPNPPWDPSDFGRCMRLLEAAPDLRPPTAQDGRGVPGLGAPRTRVGCARGAVPRRTPAEDGAEALKILDDAADLPGSQLLQMAETLEAAGRNDHARIFRRLVERDNQLRTVRELMAKHPPRSAR